MGKSSVSKCYDFIFSWNLSFHLCWLDDIRMQKHTVLWDNLVSSKKLLTLDNVSSSSGKKLLTEPQDLPFLDITMVYVWWGELWLWSMGDIVNVFHQEEFSSSISLGLQLSKKIEICRINYLVPKEEKWIGYSKLFKKREMF